MQICFQSNLQYIDAQKLQKIIKETLKAKYPLSKLIKLRANKSRSPYENYNRGLGWICAHVLTHSKSEDQAIMNAVKLVQLIDSKSLEYKNTIQKCVTEFLSQRSLQTYGFETFSDIIDRYKSSLLLEYIPIEYSNYAIQIYLEQYDNMIKQRVNYAQLLFFRMVSSLMQYLLYTKNIMNVEHFRKLALQCYMGIVQWPIVISNSNLMNIP